MNFVIKYIRCLWLVVFLCIATTSCDSDADLPDLTGEERLLSIGFKVATSNGFELEAGADRENYVDWKNSYRIYFFDIDKKYIAQFKPKNGVTSKASDDENATEYKAVGEIPEELISRTMNGNYLKAFKIVVLANWDSYPDENTLTPGVTTIDNICEAEEGKFNCLFPTDLGKTESDWKIPFYGVQEYESMLLTKETTELETPVALLRAMTKVEVILDPTIKDESGNSTNGQWSDFFIISLTLRHYNMEGYCAPIGVYERKDYPDEKENPTLHLVENSKNDNLVFYQESTNKWIAYVPEYSNHGTDKSYIEMKLNYQLEKDDPYKLYFADYSGGTTPSESNIDLIRNNIYRFTVSKKGYQMQLYVSNWEGYYENDFEYGNGQFTTPVAPWEDEIEIPIEY